MNEFEDARFPNDLSPQKLRMLEAARRQIDTLEGGLKDLTPFSTKSASERINNELAAAFMKPVAIFVAAVFCAYIVVEAAEDWRLTEPVKAVEISSAAGDTK